MTGKGNNINLVLGQDGIDSTYKWYLNPLKLESASCQKVRHCFLIGKSWVRAEYPYQIIFLAVFFFMNPL